MNKKIAILITGLIILNFSCSSHISADSPIIVDESDIIIVGERDIYEVIKEAPPHSYLIFDRNRSYTLSEPLIIDKPLTIHGLHARLPDDLGGTPLIFVTAEGFKIVDFELHGNADTVTDIDSRESGLVISAGNFIVKNGLLKNITQHGVLIASSKYHRPQSFLERWGGATPATESGFFKNGVVRNLLIESVSRDGVSITGRNGRVSHVLIENIRSFGGSDRGAVEVADGCYNITVRNIYAEDSNYALDIMHDHGEQNGYKTEINRNHYAENIHAVRSRSVVRTRNEDLGHTGLTLRNITAENCDTPVQVSNITGVTIDGVSVIDHQGGGPLLEISNVHGLDIRNVSLLSGNLNVQPIQIRNSTHIRVEELQDIRQDLE